MILQKTFRLGDVKLTKGPQSWELLYKKFKAKAFESFLLKTFDINQSRVRR